MKSKLTFLVLTVLVVLCGINVSVYAKEVSISTSSAIGVSSVLKPLITLSDMDYNGRDVFVVLPESNKKITKIIIDGIKVNHTKMANNEISLDKLHFAGPGKHDVLIITSKASYTFTVTTPLRKTHITDIVTEDTRVKINLPVTIDRLKEILIDDVSVKCYAYDYDTIALDFTVGQHNVDIITTKGIFTLNVTIKEKSAYALYYREVGVGSVFDIKFINREKLKTVSYSTSNSDVAIVTSGGSITALKSGRATITCVANDEYVYKLSLVVLNRLKEKFYIENVKDVYQTGENPVAYIHTTVKCGQRIVFPIVNTKNLKYAITNKKDNVEVSSDGVITGIKKGHCTVVAKANGFKWKLRVTVE